MLATLMVAYAAALSSPAQATPIVVDFDDLAPETDLTGTQYAGLTWELGSEGYQWNRGFWSTAPEGMAKNYPHSQPLNVINAWGALHMGISFPRPVTVVGAYFAAVGDFWPSYVQVYGYRDGAQVAVTGRFSSIRDEAIWFQMDLVNVDHIAIECPRTIISLDGWSASWYSMDDLTYLPEPASALLLALGGFITLHRRRA